MLQAATSTRPGYPERLEIHGTRGTATVMGDQLTAWDVQDGFGEKPPLAEPAVSSASDPMSVSLIPFERQILDFAHACRTSNPPLSSASDAYRALSVVQAIYDSCRSGNFVRIPQ